jgi:hypothetical protein
MPTATALRPLTSKERQAVLRKSAELRATIANWVRVRLHFGTWESDRLSGHRSPALALQSFVRASREVGIDILPTLRACFGRPLMYRRDRFRTPRQLDQTRRVLAAARSHPTP